MTAKWSEVEASKNYQRLTNDEKSQVRQRYFDNVISKAESYNSLKPEEQAQVKTRFFGKAQKPQVNVDELFNKYQNYGKQIQSEQRKFDAISYGDIGMSITGKPTIPMAQKQYNVIQSLKQEQGNILKQMQNAGINNEDFKLALLANKMVKQPRYGRMIGGAIGGTAAPAIAAGFGITNPLGLAATAMFGAGALGIAGDATQTGIEERRLITPSEALRDFAVESATEGVGRGIWALGGKAISPFVKKPNPEIADIVKEYGEVSKLFSPADLDKRWNIKLAENLSKSSWGTDAMWKSYNTTRANAAKAYAYGLIDKATDTIVKSNKFELGGELADMLSPEKYVAGKLVKPKGKILSMLDDATEPLYQQFNEMTGGKVLMDISSLKKEIKSILAKDISISSKNAAKEGSGLMPSDAKAMFERILDKKNVIPFKIDDPIQPDFMKLRSQVLKEARELSRDKNLSDTYVSKLSDLFNNALENPKNYFYQGQGFSRKPVEKEAMNLLTNTNALYAQIRAAKETYFSESFMKALEKNPSQVLNKIFDPKDPDKIEAYRLAFTDSKGLFENKYYLGKVLKDLPEGTIQQIPNGKKFWNYMRNAWLADMVDKSIKKGEGGYLYVSGKGFSDAIEKAGGMNVIKKAWSEAEQNKAHIAVDKIQKVMNVISKENKDGGASLFVHGAQAKSGAVAVGLGVGGYGKYKNNLPLEIAGGAIALSPLAFVKLAQTELGSSLIRAGFKARKGSPVIATTAARLINLYNAEEEKEKRIEEIRKRLLQPKLKQIMMTMPRQ